MTVVRPRQTAVSSRGAMVLASGGALLLGLMTASQVYLSMLGHDHSFARILVWQLGSSAFWAVTGPWVVGLASREVPLRALVPLGIALVAAHVVVATEVTAYVHPFASANVRGFLEPTPFVDALSNSVPYLALVDPVFYTLLVVGGRSIAAREQAWLLRLRESQLESEVARAQLDALRLEIEPHFLFNTLNSIAALIRLKDHNGALSMLVRLSDLMRQTLERGAGQYTSLEDELSMVTRYVELQRARFPERLSVSYSIDPACRAATVPAFMLQPIVENALRHGLMPHAESGSLEIGALGDATTVRLWVRNSGQRLPADFDVDASAGTGLRNIVTRLRRIYGGRASFCLRTDGENTIAELVLPRTEHPRAVPA